MKQEAPRNASDRSDTSSTATTVPAPAHASDVPVRFRLSARTCRIGLEGVAAAKALLAEQAERRAERDSERAALKGSGAQSQPRRAA